jgi:uncharacterized membrane protein (UPF0127 family)
MSVDERTVWKAGLAIVAAGILVACSGGGAADGQGSADGEAASAVDSAQTSQEAAGGDTTETTARSSDTTELTVDGITITAEVADEDEERQRGLMHRDSLPENHGMLFVYPEERTLSFWMRDTRIPLDIAFLDGRGTIVDIQQMEPQSDEQHRSAEPAMYALEMRQGWFADHGIEIGARVSF